MENLKIISLVMLMLIGISLVVSSLAPQSKRSYLRFLGVAFLMLAGAMLFKMFSPESIGVLIFNILALLSFIMAIYESILVTRENLRQLRLRQQAREEALGEMLKTIAENPPEEKE